MKTIIAGSRSIKNYNKVAEIINRYNEDLNFQDLTITEVVSGGANGVDSLGEIWAEEHDIPFKRFPADWDIHGKSAGYIRNEEMADYADALLAIWDAKSRGTKHMIDIMHKMKKPIEIIIIK